MTRVGWVGLGAMGLPMARCVVRAGYELHLDPTATWEVIRGGAAASFMLDDRGERMVHDSFVIEVLRGNLTANDPGRPG